MNPKDEVIKYKVNHTFNKSLLFKERMRNPIISAIIAVVMVVTIFSRFKGSKLYNPPKLICF